MIPPEVDSYLAKDTGEILRPDRKAAEAALQALGVPLGTEFADFYLKYQGGFISPRPVAELLDIEGPVDPNIPVQTEYAQDRYGLPHKYLALTSDESEGMYVYNKEDRAVYDMDFDNLKDLLDDRLAARWPTFNTFLSWYFDESEG